MNSGAGARGQKRKQDHANPDGNTTLQASVVGNRFAEPSAARDQLHVDSEGSIVHYGRRTALEDFGVVHSARKQLSDNKFAGILETKQNPVTVIQITRWASRQISFLKMPQ